MKKQIKPRKPRKVKNKTNSLMRVVLTGMVVGPAVMLVASAILSFAALKVGNPAGSIFPLALFSIFLGGLVSSIRSAKVYKEKPSKAGLLTGLANLALITVISLISSQYSGGLWNVLLPPVFIIASSIIGTIIVARMKPNTKRRLKKLRKQVR
jgi:putative membrane protein (TIGR04086 family)